MANQEPLNGLSAAQLKNQTQWTAQFLVASELVRRGNLVTFTMGNHTPGADLMVRSPNGKSYLVDVKGQKSNNSWHIEPHPEMPDLYAVLVRLADPNPVRTSRSHDKCYVLKPKDIWETVERYERENPNHSRTARGFTFPKANPFLEKWENLPD